MRLPAVRVAVLAGVAMLPCRAIAQDAPPAPAQADEGAQDGDLVVTARRRGESLQDVPIAVTVVDGEQIDNSGAFNVGRLQQLTPTLQFYSSNPRNTSVNIRGLGSPFGLTNDGIEQGVGIYVDDVYYSRVASETFDFLNVAQIETLRGPQGTLYGKNTTAGAINITTRQPTFDLDARAEGTIGNLGFRQAKGAIGGPSITCRSRSLAAAALPMRAMTGRTGRPFPPTRRRRRTRGWTGTACTISASDSAPTPGGTSMPLRATRSTRNILSSSPCRRATAG